MINYNDGEWHRHTGCMIPEGLHYQSIVEIRTLNPHSEFHGASGIARGWSWLDWGGDTIIAFRVIKPYQEPREFWIDELDMTATQTPCHASGSYIHVREVIE